MTETSPQIQQDLVSKLKHGQVKKLFRLLKNDWKVTISYGTLENYLKAHTLKPRTELIETINKGLIEMTKEA